MVVRQKQSLLQKMPIIVMRKTQMETPQQMPNKDVLLSLLDKLEKTKKPDNKLGSKTTLDIEAGDTTVSSHDEVLEASRANIITDEIVVLNATSPTTVPLENPGSAKSASFISRPIQGTTVSRSKILPVPKSCFHASVPKDAIGNSTTPRLVRMNVPAPIDNSLVKKANRECMPVEPVISCIASSQNVTVNTCSLDSSVSSRHFIEDSCIAGTSSSSASGVARNGKDREGKETDKGNVVTTKDLLYTDVISTEYEKHRHEMSNMTPWKPIKYSYADSVYRKKVTINETGDNERNNGTDNSDLQEATITRNKGFMKMLYKQSYMDMSIRGGIDTCRSSPYSSNDEEIQQNEDGEDKQNIFKKVNNYDYLVELSKAYVLDKPFTTIMFEEEVLVEQTSKKMKLVRRFVVNQIIRCLQRMDSWCKQCPICNTEKQYNTRSKLTHHIGLHTGLKLFQCTMCSKRFSSNPALKSHNFTHVSTFPFGCPAQKCIGCPAQKCIERFKKKEELEQHKRNEHYSFEFEKENNLF